MSMMPLPPEDLFKKIVPIICGIVGAFFVIGGMVCMVLLAVFLFGKGENTHKACLVLLGVSVANLSVGTVVIRYMPKFMLSQLQKLKKDPLF